MEPPINIIAVDQMEVIDRSNDCTVYQYQDEAGYMLVSVYNVFPGIELHYKDFRREDCVLKLESPPENIFVIEHCHKGRVECQAGEYFFYLSAGDLTLRRTTRANCDISFPVEHYQGIDILVDTDKVPKCLTCLLPDVDVEPGRLVRKFGLDDNAFHFLRQNRRLEHIFSELYDIPESIRKGYLKVKILEILLFMTGMELEEEDIPQRRIFPKQVRLAKEAHAYLAENMHKHITIAQLAQRFGTSQTYLKDSFRKVYGTSVQGLISEQKMLAAARELQETDRKVTDIAGEYGYANASKFSSAFRRVMGISPAEYRMKMETKGALQN